MTLVMSSSLALTHDNLMIILRGRSATTICKITAMLYNDRRSTGEGDDGNP
jgi:hypothetical protein